MSDTQTLFEQLKKILETLSNPEQLNNHPWTESLVVQDMLLQDPTLENKKPGEQLVLSLGTLFKQMQPATPPTRGKRLDTRWGRFGLLAANYFAPFLHGQRSPNSMRDAWRRIDQAILLFVFEKSPDMLSPDEIEPYQLIGDDIDFAANSTISDWHRSGLQEFAEFFENREKHLSTKFGKPSPLLEPEKAEHFNARVTRHPGKKNLNKRFMRWTMLLPALLLAAALIFLSVKARKILNLVQTVKTDITSLQGLNLNSFEPDELNQIGPLLENTRNDLDNLKTEVSPWLWLSSNSGWIPVYGGDLEAAEDLLDMADSALESAEISYQSVFPIWQAIYQTEEDIKATELTGMFLESQPALIEAQAALEKAMLAREQIHMDQLSPKTRLLITKFDPYTTLLNESLSLSRSIPGLLGGTNDGPKTYLILIQNEDELRPTGGFITAVGKVVVANGQIINWEVSDAYEVDSIGEFYPPSPWQMNHYMNIQTMVFRDSNWFPDYPRAVRWAEYLYAYRYAHSVDGVIAIDQHVLVSILSVTGPVYVSEIGQTVTAENIRETMRSQKIPPPEEERDPDWHRKQFMNPTAKAIINRLLSGKDLSWEQVIKTMFTEMNQRHILVQLDDPELSEVLADRGWDGAIRYKGGDFLLTIDTNIGYNKTNAVINSWLDYDVDLTNLSAPHSILSIFHKNNASGQDDDRCFQMNFDQGVESDDVERWYAINRCYYNYLRVYVPEGAILTGSSPHAVIREDMIMLLENVPARVDQLNESIDQIQSFGTLLMVRKGETLQTGFEFDLPENIIQPGTGREKIYILTIQKQAGVVSMPVTLRVHLPNNAEIVSTAPQALIESTNLLFELELREDIEVEIVFRP
ncbi:MAG: DUF4012 domain-containing protein [Anaerolineales bacterium]|nr:DUF4012 domain-containing protein [Anaerolineales bacterium]